MARDYSVYYKKNRNRIVANKIEYRKQYYPDNADAIRAKKREYYHDMHLLVISHYGGKCAVCGEIHPAMLCLDHIGGGGREQVRQPGGKRELYRSINY